MVFDSLPVELVTEISEYLAASYSFGSLAGLNATCKWIQEATLPILYRTVILLRRKVDGRNDLKGWKDVGQSLLGGCQHTR
jgi:hypothetical protein